MNGPTTSTTRSVLQILAFVATWLFIVYLLVGPLALAYVALFTGGFVLWWLTAHRAPVDPHKIIVPYLLTVIGFIAHVYEEYKAHLMGFPDIVAGAPFPISFEHMLTFAASVAPILWLLGAVMMLGRWTIGYFVASTFLFGMMFVEPSHFVAPFVQRGGGFQYVGGMWTAPLPILFGWYTFFAMRRRSTVEEHAVGAGS